MCYSCGCDYKVNGPQWFILTPHHDDYHCGCKAKVTCCYVPVCKKTCGCHCNNCCTCHKACSCHYDKCCTCKKTCEKACHDCDCCECNNTPV